MSNSTLAIGETSIRQLDGLFSLNDLHAASGGNENQKPAFFLRNEQAQSLLDEIAKGADLHLFLKTIKGRNGGTYACKELVIAYAAWISAKFHLKVIRVFLDAHVAQPTITLANRRWLISFDEAGRELVEPVARDAHILTASGFARALSEPGIFTRHELLEIVNAANQRLYQSVCNDGAPGIGDQVVKIINRDLPQSDLRQIVTSAALELWMRSPVFDNAK